MAIVFRVGGELMAYVRRFSDGRVWYAEDRHRVVVPQLALKSSELSLSSSDTLSIANRVKSLEEDMLKIKKIINI